MQTRMQSQMSGIVETVELDISYYQPWKYLNKDSYFHAQTQTRCGKRY